MSELSSQPTVIQSLYEWYRDGTLYVNRNYQRKLVWTLDEKQKLLDSVLRQYPIPLVLLAERKEEGSSKYEILDGLQRLHTIFSFVEHQFVLADGRCFDLKEFARAREVLDAGHFEELAPEIPRIKRPEVSRILGYTLPISIIRNASAEEITDVFGRINTYGHRLSDQERRQAGLLTGFSLFVRKLSCEVRGDVSVDTIPLHKMPAISIDLPKTKHGYGLSAEEIFWTRHGVLRATDLRDSDDEQAIADIGVAILRGDPVERAKGVLDDIYNPEEQEAQKIEKLLANYGEDKLARELKACLEVIDKIVGAGSTNSLRALIFAGGSTNPFATLFAALVIAVHELTVRESLMLSDPKKGNEALSGSRARLKTGRDAVAVEERRKNVDTLKGLLRDAFVPTKKSKSPHGPPLLLDFENALRRSRIETPAYECKQGCLRLNGEREISEGIFEKVIQTICAIANIGPGSEGAVFVGVADSKEDADRIKVLDRTDFKTINGRYVVGVDREVVLLKEDLEQYFKRWRVAIEKSELNQALKVDILSEMDLVDYKGVHVLWLRVPSQRQVSLVGDKCFVRKGSVSVEIRGAEMIAIAERFSTSAVRARTSRRGA